MTSTTSPHASPLAPRGFFVTGTDTGVGKTRVAVALIHALRARGLRVAAMKPVAAGNAPGELNEDVAALLGAANVAADLEDVNPYAFAEIDDAPHVNRFIDLHDIGDMLIHAGFASPVMEMDMLTLTYADLKTLMRDLKGIGAHNAAAARRRACSARPRGRGWSRPTNPSGWKAGCRPPSR